MPTTAGLSAFIVKRAWPPAATRWLTGEKVTLEGMLPEPAAKSTDALKAPSGSTVVMKVVLEPELMSSVKEVEVGLSVNPAGPIVMKGKLRELSALPVGEFALMKACVVWVLAAPTAATRVNTALAEPPAGTAMVCDVPDRKSVV